MIRGLGVWFSQRTLKSRFTSGSYTRKVKPVSAIGSVIGSVPQLALLLSEKIFYLSWAFFLNENAIRFPGRPEERYNRANDTHKL